VLDQLVDRIGDVAMIAGLWVLGAPGPLCAAAAMLTLLDESIRSSAGAAGMVEIGVVTLPERPARLVVGGLSLAAAGIVPSAAALTVTVGAALWTAMTLVTTVQLVVNVRRRLRGQPRKVLDADPGD
jgi:phosphatidylglycerophosphate synthase